MTGQVCGTGTALMPVNTTFAAKGSNDENEIAPSQPAPNSLNGTNQATSTKNRCIIKTEVEQGLFSNMISDSDSGRKHKESSVINEFVLLVPFHSRYFSTSVLRADDASGFIAHNQFVKLHFLLGASSSCISSRNRNHSGNDGSCHNRKNVIPYQTR